MTSYNRAKPSAKHTLCKEGFVDQPRDDVPPLNVEVVVWAVDVCWDDTCKLAAVLLVVCSVQRHETIEVERISLAPIVHINKTLGMRIAKV